MEYERSTIVYSVISNGMETKILNNTRGGHCSGAALRVKCKRRGGIHDTVDVQDVSSICAGAWGTTVVAITTRVRTKPVAAAQRRTGRAKLRAVIIVTQYRVRGY